MSLTGLPYQKAVYNPARIPQMITDNTINEGLTLNIRASISIPCGLFLLRGSASVTAAIVIRIIAKTHDILFKKGISAIYPPLSTGKNLKSVDKGMVSTAAVSAAAEVVRFQKNPNRKMAKTPGEIKPTYSCTN
jgi:hypothetical protein